MDIHAEDPDDTSRRSVLSDVVSALGSQWKELTNRAPRPASPPSNPAGPPLRAKSNCAPGPVIKPSSHQRVAIDVHRDDWP